MKYWDRVKFWWTCTWYSFPIIGKISKLSKDITSVDEKSNWFSSETTLCSDFIDTMIDFKETQNIMIDVNHI